MAYYEQILTLMYYDVYYEQILTLMHYDVYYEQIITLMYYDVYYEQIITLMYCDVYYKQIITLMYYDVYYEQIITLMYYDVYYEQIITLMYYGLLRADINADASEFLDEAIAMKDFNHENVLMLIGVAIKNERPLIILPFMANGDLKSFVSNKENVSILNFWTF